jgi:HSP20 family protein
MLLRFNGDNDFNRLHHELSRWFDAGFQNVASAGASWTPAADVIEDADGLTLTFDLPQVDPNDVELHLENAVLTVRGERKAPEKREGALRLERPHGKFSRSFSLPSTLDFDAVHAEAKLGVLTVSIPRRAETRPRTIPVKVSA